MHCFTYGMCKYTPPCRVVLCRPGAALIPLTHRANWRKNNKTNETNGMADETKRQQWNYNWKLYPALLGLALSSVYIHFEMPFFALRKLKHRNHKLFLNFLIINFISIYPSSVSGEATPTRLIRVLFEGNNKNKWLRIEKKLPIKWWNKVMRFVFDVIGIWIWKLNRMGFYVVDCFGQL